MKMTFGDAGREERKTVRVRTSLTLCICGVFVFFFSFFLSFSDSLKSKHLKAQSVFFPYSLVWLGDTEDLSLGLASDLEVSRLRTNYIDAISSVLKGVVQYNEKNQQSEAEDLGAGGGFPAYQLGGCRQGT